MFLPGFSQGAALCTLEAVTGSMKIAGVIALSGYLPSLALSVGSSFAPAIAQADLGMPRQRKNKRAEEIPLFIAHGQDDAVIKLSLAKLGAEKLKAAGMKGINWNEYNGKSCIFTSYYIRFSRATHCNRYEPWVLQRRNSRFGIMATPNYCTGRNIC
jgi:alpha-beta hydrolase superfamily lysophospholipase